MRSARDSSAAKFDAMQLKNEALESELLEGRENEMMLRNKLQGTSRETERLLKAEVQTYRNDLKAITEKFRESERIAEEKQRTIQEMEFKLINLESKNSEASSGTEQALKIQQTE